MIQLRKRTKGSNERSRSASTQMASKLVASRSRLMRIEALEGRRMLTLVEVPSTTHATFEESNELDSYTVNTTAGELYQFAVNATVQKNILLRDQNGTLVGSVFQRGSDNEEVALLSWMSAADTTLEVQVINRTEIGDYSLSVSVVDYVDDHGSLPSTASPIVVPEVSHGDINVSHDVDFFSFTASAGEIFEFRLDFDSSEFVHLRLLNASGVELDSVRSRRQIGIDWFAESTGTYYLAVSSPSQINDYELTTEMVSYNDDFGNLLQNATTVAVPSTTMGEIEVHLDRDFFSFSALANSRYNIAVPRSLTRQFALFDEHGIPQHVETAFAGSERAGSWTATVAGDYYVLVTDSNQSDNDQPYTLQVWNVTDDHGDAANAATPLSLPVTAAWSNDFVGDQDFFSFMTTAGAIYRFDASSGSNASIFDADGIEIEEFRFRGAEHFWVAPADGIYPIAVMGEALALEDYHLSVEEVDYVDDHGNTSANSTLVDVPSETSGAIEVRLDRDFFSFVAVPNTQYNLSGPSTLGSIRLLAPDGVTQIAESVVTGEEQTVSGRVTEDGTYFVEVRGFDWQDEWLPYTLRLEVPSDDYGNVPDEATQLPLPISTHWSKDYVGDQDVFSFTAVSGAIYQISGTWGTVATIFNSSGSEIIHDLALREGGTSWVAPSDGTFPISLSGPNLAFQDYTFGVEELIYDDDHGSSFSTATPVLAPSITLGEIEVFGDRDFFSFSAQSGTIYNLIVGRSQPINGSTRSTLRLFDTDGTTELVATRQGDGVGTSWTAPADGIYFLSIREACCRLGPYAVEIQTPIDDHGNEAADATPVLSRSVTTGAIEIFGDSDFFSFSAVAGTDYNFFVNPLFLGRQTLSGVNVRLFDTDGVTELVRETGFFSWVAPADGDFVLSLFGRDFEQLGPYSLEIEVPVDDHGNDADNATPVAIPSTTIGRIGVPGDLDFFSFETIAGAVYEFGREGNDGIDWQLYGTDGAGNLTEQPWTGDRLLRPEWLAPSSSTYYVRMSDLHDDELRDYSWALKEILYDDDHGNVAANSTLVSAPSQTSGLIENDADEDVFSFVAEAGTYYNVTVMSEAANLRLFDTDGIRQLAFADNFGVNTLLSWVAPSDGTYFVTVAGPGRFDSGYSLSLEVPTDDHGGQTAEATSVTLPFSANATIDWQADTDVFAFNALAGESYDLFTSSGTAGDNTWVSVFDADGTTLLGSSRGSHLNWTASTGGTYFLEIRIDDPRWIGSYEANIIVDAHGDTREEATIVMLPLVVSGSISAFFDQDHFAFTAQQGRIYDLLLVPHEAASINMYLRRAEGGTVEVIRNDGQGGSAYFRWRNAPDGEYVVQILGDPGEYDFELREVTDAHGDTFDSATAIGVPSTRFSELEDFSDKDYFSFPAIADTPYRFEVIEGTVPDAALRLYDSDGVTELALDSDEQDGDAESILWTAPRNGTYFLEVSVNSVFVTDWGTYSLTMENNADGLACDFVAGEGCDLDDLDALYAGTNGAPEILTDESIAEWLVQASARDNPSKLNLGDQYVLGDVNLDGRVDSSDLGLLLNSFGDNSGLTWRSGNLNSDENIDSADLGLLLNNFSFTSEADATARTHEEVPRVANNNGPKSLGMPKNVGLKSSRVESAAPSSLRDLVFGGIDDEDDDGLFV